jgi:cellobiose-specific phosphotransferase system component IIA
MLLGAVVALTACAVSAQMPVRNIDPYRHGNLAAAQRLVVQAFERLSDAQDANDYRLGGHAERAKELLRQANDEIKMAAEAANRR